MMLVADSGSTKSQWADVETGNMIVTEGLNPHLSSDAVLLGAFEQVRQYYGTPARGCTIAFYGAGCGDRRQAERMETLLKKAFESMSVSIESDLLGACRAVSGGEPCLVGILGTGSNACYYDGSSIVLKRPSLGYLLGDEGSANHVGRLLLRSYLNGTMDEELSLMFHDTYPYSHSDWLHQLYQRPNANRFLASLAPFAVSHCERHECAELINNVLYEWYNLQLLPLQQKSGCGRLRVVGGFAKAIEPQLRESMAHKGLEVDGVMAAPIEGLIRHHRGL